MSDERENASQQELSEEEKTEIIRRLEESGLRGGCPMCEESNWVLADGYLNQSLQGNLSSGLSVGGPSIPSVAIICSNCGFMSQHALGALGLLPDRESAETPSGEAEDE